MQTVQERVEEASPARRLSLVAVIASISVVGVTFGITTPLLSILMDGMGASRTLIGLNASMPAIAAILLAPVLPRFVARLGPRLFMALSLAGVLLTPFTGVAGWPPFIAAVAMTALAGVPLLFAGRDTPAMATHEAGDVLQYLRQAPDAIGAAFLMGVLYFGIFSLLPLYGLSLGFDTPASARMVAVAGTGLVVCPLLIGWLADRMDRRRLLQAIVLVMLLCALALPWAMLQTWSRSALLFLISGGLIGLYTLGLTLLGQRFRGGRLAAANGAFVLMFGVGEMLGPPYMGAAMDFVPPHGFAWSVAGVCAGYLVFLLSYRADAATATGTRQ